MRGVRIEADPADHGGRAGQAGNGDLDNPLAATASGRHKPQPLTVIR